MKRLMLLNLAIVFAVAAVVFAPMARANTYNNKTVMTFTQSIELPGGKVFPAGTYAFTVLDHTAYRHVIQVFNEDKTELYATVLAIPNYRLHATDKTVITFEERPAKTPQAVKAWFYPGETFGHEFVYPAPKAAELAKATNEPVPSMPSELTADLSLPIKSAGEAPVSTLENAPVTAAEPNGGEATVAEVFPQEAPKNLPHTASPVPLIALIGMLSLTAGFAVRTFAKQTA